MEREKREVRLQSERHTEQKERVRDGDREGQPWGMKRERESDEIGNTSEREHET